MEEPADEEVLGSGSIETCPRWVSKRATSVVTVCVHGTVVVAVHTAHPSMLVWSRLQRRRPRAMSCDAMHTFRPESIRAISKSCLLEVCTTPRRAIRRQERTCHCSGIDRKRRIGAWGGGLEAWFCFFRGMFLDFQRTPLSLCCVDLERWSGDSGCILWRQGLRQNGHNSKHMRPKCREGAIQKASKLPTCILLLHAPASVAGVS